MVVISMGDSGGDGSDGTRGGSDGKVRMMVVALKVV